MRTVPLALLFLLVSAGATAALAQDEPPDSVMSRPMFTPYDKGPELKNRLEAQRSVERHFPKKLADAEIGGKVWVWVFVDAEGRVRNAQLGTSSGNEKLDDGAVAAVWEFEFIPARFRDRAVAVWIQVPISFSVHRSPKQAQSR